MKQVTKLISVSAFVCVFMSCSQHAPQLETSRVPVEPPGNSQRVKPWNETQRYEAEAALGPLASPRR